MHLPDDIRVLYSEQCDPSFHARFSAKKKLYSYTVQLGPHKDVFARNTSLHLHTIPDVEKMQLAAAMVIGTHDFASFKCSGSGMENTVRTISRSDWVRNGHYLTYTVEGNGFLYNMVRILVGTMLEIGSGKRDVSDMLQALERRNRSSAGATAPAHGLCLTRVSYPDFDTEEVLKREGF
jgi:tRNA pseudouridine38-40 synthase